MNYVAYEKLKFTIKSIIFTAFIVFACGSMGAVLFAPELAAGTQSASGYDAVSSFTLKERLLDINWSKLASLDNIEQMAQGCAILRASPEGMIAIVTFHLIRKMYRGESITMANIGDEIIDTLPTGLLPDPGVG
jgi:hypothetical protein